MNASARRSRRPRRISAKDICVARVPAHLYKREATRCEKKARVNVHGLDLCRHHEGKAKRGHLEVWAPAIPGGQR